VGSLILLNLTTSGDVTAEPITTLTLQNSFLIFFTGVIASATAIIPGVSGSMVQLAIGMYSTFIAALSDVNVPILIVMLSGMILGLIFAAKMIGWLLEKAYHVTYVGIMGLLIGSIIQILPEPETASLITYTMYVLVFILGFLLAFSSNAFDKKKTEIKLKKEI
jgi:putative membrane protein